MSFISIHMLFWSCVWLFFVYFFGFNSENKNYIYWYSSVLLPVTMVATYFVIYFLIPKYLLRKKYFLFVVYGVYSVIGVSNLIVLAMLGGFVFMTKYNYEKIPPLSFSLPMALIGVYMMVVFVSSIKLLKYNYEALDRNKSLENKILETQLSSKEQELHFLKKQIHPHFLFNTLNTIYGFALRKSEDTPEVILKLSNLLDYILYQVDKPKVALTAEVLHIKEYIALEKIRFQDTLNIAFKASDILSEFQVAPMLLIPFVENAFKHGDLIDGVLDIQLDLKIVDGCLHFKIQNTVLGDNEPKVDRGLGLKNIRQRLDLVYANNYELKIEHQKNMFSVYLKIRNLNIKNEG